MSGAAPRGEESGRLTGARGEFVGSLPRRLEMLRSSLGALEQLPADPERQNGLLRRLHALGSSSRVLGFASVAEALGEAEKLLRGALMTGKPLPLTDVGRTLDMVPSLASDQAAEREPGTRTWPISVLVFGAQAIADAIGQGRDVNVECERTEDPLRARELARVIGPDVAVIDADRRGARELCEIFAQDQLIEPVPLLVVGSFDTKESAQPFIELGVARILNRPVSPDGLWRAIDQLCDRSAAPTAEREPLGQLTVAALAERIADELKRGLVDAVEGGAQATPVGFGEGADVMAAVWGAVARVRELVTLRSQGLVRFHAVGPGGAVPLAPWGAEERRAGERTGRATRDLEGVSLQGRRVVVADDDPAVVWFMSGLLKAVGVEVIEAHDGRRALELTEERWPDVVISDVLMPQLDGFSLCHEIKRDVIVRDTPVILLSWKEDLLQRLRELGADADGYLRKEAAASAVVERVREVLRARARVEQRIAAGGEVRGRLDGLTVRLLLELVCRGKRDARIAVRDAVYLWELAVRGGQLLSISRSSPAGDFARGTSVLPGLLGVSAGRFAVEPDSAPTRSEFRGDLAEILHEPVMRARAALRAVSAEALVRVARMTFDRPSVEAYLGCTPQPALGLIRRLLEGVSPRELVLEGQADPRLLETVLSDLARRGAVESVEREPGASLFPAQPPAPIVRVRPTQDDELDWDEELSENDISPLARAMVAPAAPLPEAVEPEPLRVAGAAAMPFSEQTTPADWSSGPLFAFGGVEIGTLPGVGESGLPAVEPRPAEPTPEPAAAAAEEPSPPAVAAAESPVPEPEDVVPEPEVPADALAQTLVATSPPAPVVSEPAPSEHSPLPLAELARISAREPAPVPSAPDLEVSVGFDESLSAEDDEVVPSNEEDDELAAVLNMGEVSVLPPPASIRRAPAPLPPEEERQRSPFSEPPPKSAPLTTDALLAAVSPAPPVIAKVPSLKTTAMMDFGVSPTPAPPVEPVEDEDEQEEQEEVREPEPVVSKRAASHGPVSHARKNVALPASSRDAVTLRPRGRKNPLWSSVLLPAALSAAVVFAVFTWGIMPLIEKPTTESEPEAAASAPLLPPPPAPKPTAVAAQPKTETLPLPTGIEVQNGLGLLEVEVSEPLALYIDGEFVGKVVLRRAPLQPGRHQVTIGEGADGQTVSVDITVGARTRVTLPAPPPR
ncbi:MAG TPA: response regulator [Polyangiaceae bacterium]|nr:response regulator [Polyangiaceae bacterium]